MSEEDKEPNRWLIKCSRQFFDSFFMQWAKTNYDKSKAEETNRYSRSINFWRTNRES